MKNRFFIINLILILFTLFTSCPNGQDVPIVKDITTAVVVNGVVGKEVTSIEIPIELEKGNFKAMDANNTPVSSWFGNDLVAGLQYKLKGSVSENATSLTIIISGTPEDESTALIRHIIIPQERFVKATKSVQVNLPTGSKYDINAEPEVSISQYVVVEGEKDETISPITITIKLEKGKFKAINALDVSTWFSSRVNGLNYMLSGAVSEGATSLQIVISGKPTVTSTASLGSITIPQESFVYATSGKTVNFPDGSKYNIFEVEPEVEGLTERVMIEGEQNTEISSVEIPIKLKKGKFKAIDVLDVSAWFGDKTVSGLKYELKDSVSENAISLTIVVSGTPTVVSTALLESITIPEDKFVYATKDIVVSLPNGSGYNIVKEGEPKAKALSEKVVVNGRITEEISSPITITIEFEKGHLKANSDTTTSASSWFSATAPGLEYKLASSISENATSLTLAISGTPTTIGITNLGRITIPYRMFVSATSDVVVDLPDGSLYNIKGYSYKLFDLATFADTTVQEESPNKNLTKTFKGNNLTFASDKSLKSETTPTNTITFEEGLSRRGYKLAGFNKLNSDGVVSTDVKNVEYKASVDESTGAITVSLKDSDDGKEVSLYAVWAVDPEAWGWTVNSDGSYNKTYDISGYNVISGENAYFPATFNLKQSGIDSSLRSNYVDYPYYKEAKVLSKGVKSPINSSLSYDDCVDKEDAEFTHDFAIGEQVVTGYMLDVLREWNNNGNKGYEIPKMATLDSVPKTEAVGYGTSLSSSSYVAMNDKSNPITFVTFLQGVVLSNAFTEYYNEKNGSTIGFIPLSFAYQTDRGQAVKTIAEAQVLVDATPTEGDEIYTDVTRTGFRLPTDNEWVLAARIVPESGYATELTGAHNGKNAVSFRNYMYPQITRTDMFSGADVLSLDGWVARLYAWTGIDSGDNNTDKNPTSHGFLNNKIIGSSAQNGTVLDKKPNNIGVYGMSGNVSEWVDYTTSITGKENYRRVRNAGFNYGYRSMRIGNTDWGKPSGRYSRFSLRLARTII